MSVRKPLKTFRCTVPELEDMGYVAPFLCHEDDVLTKEEDALWMLNLGRANARLPILTKLPKGTKFEQEKHWRSDGQPKKKV